MFGLLKKSDEPLINSLGVQASPFFVVVLNLKCQTVVLLVLVLVVVLT